MRRLIFAVLGLALLAACSSSRKNGMVPIEPALLTLVPGDTILLAGARIDVLQKTPAYRKHFARREFPMAGELAAKTGIDPRKDLWQCLAVSDGSHNVLLARGKFTQEMGMEPRLKVEGARRMPYKGQILIGAEDAAVTFINPTTAVFGKAEAVRHLLDQRPKASVPAAIQETLRLVPAESQFWVVALGGRNIAELGIPPEGNLANLAKIYGSLQRMMLAADLRSGIHVQGRGTAATDEDAKRLAAALKGLIGLGRLNTPDNRPELLKAFDAMKVEQQQRDVTFDAEIPDELVEQLVALFPQ